MIVLTTGGTIASTPSADGVVASAEGARLVAGALPGVEVRPLLSVNGFAISTAQMLTIARAACAAAADGVVVTHGTDTLEETAYLTDLLYDGDAPVIFTGAQRHAADPFGDGPSNLRAAAQLAVEPGLRGAGVLVAMDGRVDAARSARKVHSHAARAFGGGEEGPVAELGPAGLRVLRVPPRRPALPVRDLSARVALVALGAGDDGLLVEAAVAAGARGIVLDAFGLGNANPAVVAKVREAVAAGVGVLVCSRCAAGGVAPVYGNGGAVDLESAGATLAGTLPAVKARILLIAALGSAASTADALALAHSYVM